MGHISIDSYNQNERSATKGLSNRFVQAFSPVLFDDLGYRSRVTEESELFYFVDVMQEHRFFHYFDSVLNNITEEEFRLFKNLTGQIAEFTHKHFSRKGTGKNSVVHSLNVLRHIQFLSKGAPLRILELGPGCGYLGAMLQMHGHNYAAFDVAQAFYLYQNRFWTFLFGDSLTDLADGTLGSRALSEALDRGMVHLPWWQFSNLYKGKVPAFDVITCNHMLCEMQVDSLSYTFRLCQDLLAQSDGPRAVVLEGWGWNAMNRLANVVETIYKFGFVIAHSDEKITILLRREDAEAGGFIEYSQSIQTHGIVWNNGKLYIDETVVPFKAPQTKLFNLITESRERHATQQNVTSGEATAYLTELVGEENLRTDDEKFWDYVTHKRE